MLYLLTAALAAETATVFVCPKGSEQNGTRCRLYTKKNLVPDCGLDGQMHDADQCAKYVHGVHSCRDGKMKNGLCERFDVQEPLVFCEEDYFLVKGSQPHGHKKEHGAFCYKTNEVGGDRICPWGTIDEGNRCVIYTKFEPIFDCPPGSVQQGRGCTISERYQCEDQVLEAKKAKKSSDKGHHHHRRLGKKQLKTNTIGKESYVVTDIHQICERTVSVDSTMSCPRDSQYDRQEDMCLMITEYPRELALTEPGYLETEPIVVCPNMYERCYGDGKFKDYLKKDQHALHCCGFTTETPIVECPIGYNFDLASAKCIGLYHPEYVCPPEASGKEGHSCQIYEYVDAIQMEVPGHQNIPSHHKKKSHH